MERYAKYLRKSRFDRDYTELSVEETLKRHEEILDRLVQDRGYNIVRTYREVVSGESISARPEIRKLLKEVNAGMYTGVLVVDVERLARGNGADQAYISQVFQFSGTKIITPTKVYDPNNEFDEEYFEFGLFMSRREYKTINRRLVRGRESSAAEGKYLGSIAPYGYDRMKLPDQKGYTLTPNGAEAETVRKIFELYNNRYGTKMIANRLNDLAVPTRRGEPWTYSTVAGIVANPVYTGKIKRGYCRQYRTLDESGNVRKQIRHMKNPEDYSLYDGLHPPLIDDETFRTAQKIRAEKSAGAPKVKADRSVQNAFCGLIYCAECGKRIARTTAAAERGGTARFRCVNARNCRNGTADYKLVEAEIITALRSWLDGYKVRLDRADFREEIGECTAMLEKTSAEIDALSAQLERAFTLVEQGVYSAELFRERKDKLTAELAEKESCRSAAEKRLHSLESDGAERAGLIPAAEELLASYDDMTPAEKNRLLKAILQKIEYKKGRGGKIVIDIFPRLPSP